MFAFYLIQVYGTTVFLFDNDYPDLTYKKEDMWVTTSLTKAETRLKQTQQEFPNLNFKIIEIEAEYHER